MWIRIFILPHTIIGIGLLAYPILEFGTQYFGTETRVTVIDKSSSRDSEGDRHYKVEYLMPSDSEAGNKREIGVKRRIYKRLKVGDSLDIKSLPETKNLVSHVKLATDANYESPSINQIGFYMMFMLFWNFCMVAAYIPLYVLPFINWCLLRFGDVVEGEVTSLDRTEKDDTTCYSIEYSFAPEFQKGRTKPRKSQKKIGRKSTSSSLDLSSTKNTKKGSQEVDAETWSRFKVGDPVCILYSKRHPQLNRAFEFSHLELK